jgi:hypothetical protein
MKGLVSARLWFFSMEEKILVVVMLDLDGEWCV